jgi:hypothetical protein
MAVCSFSILLKDWNLSHQAAGINEKYKRISIHTQELILMAESVTPSRLRLLGDPLASAFAIG